MIGKDLAYEEAIRVPLLIRAPGALAGVSSPRVVLNNDVAPTLASFGAAVAGHVVDGVSLRPLLKNPLASWHRKTFLIERWFIPSLFKFQNPTYFAIRRVDPSLDFLYASYQTEVWGQVSHRELFDLSTDPYQLESIQLPRVVTDALDDFLFHFRHCAGEGCRHFESL